MKKLCGTSHLAVVLAMYTSLVSAAPEIHFSCAERHRLTVYELAENGERRASWATALMLDGKQTYGSCGFTNGHKIKLTDMNLFLDRASVEGKGVWVYQGIGDHCSEGLVLLFNDRTEIAMLVKVHDFSVERFKCARQ